jgi:hypothetical protein
MTKHLFDLERLRRQPVDSAFWAFYAIVLLGCLALQVSGLSIGRWGEDAHALEIAIETGGRIGANSPADWLVAALTPFLGFGPVPNLIPTALLSFVVARVAYQGNGIDRAVIFYLSFPLIFQLQFVSKEAIVTIAVVVLYGAFRLLKSNKLRLVATLVIILAMAALFRQYYFIAAGIMMATILLKQPRFVIPAVIIGICLAAFIEPVRTPLLDARYLVYRNVSSAAASIIPLYFQGYDPVSFIGNYFLSIPFYGIPFLVGVRIQELYMQIYIILAVILMTRSLSHGNRPLSALFFGITLTFPVFVAEVGTLARHLSGVIPIAYLRLFYAPHCIPKWYKGSHKTAISKDATQSTLPSLY